MSETVTPEAAAAITRAADWLEANTTKHTTGVMSADAEDWPVAPTSPDADCFCALGRIAKEANIVAIYDDEDHYPYQSVEAFLEANVPWSGEEALMETIWNLNDTSPLGDPFKGRREVITLLRQITTGANA